MADEDDDREFSDASPEESEAGKLVKADELFAGRREIWIELEGVRYRLRITRRNKLILQK